MNETSSNEIKEQSEINIPTETSVQNEVKLPRELKTEETYDPRHKREIIKNIIIVFLAVLLVLTFCSNTIMNRSLPEITTERTSSGKLTERLRGSGLVMSNQTYEVTLTGNHTVDTIMVKNGKEVKKDDVLFTVGKGENAELTTAEEALAAMELEYQKALLAMPADYSSENQAIANARADLQAAITKRDNAAASQDDQQAAKDAYNSNKSELNYYTREQAKLQATISAIDSDEYSGAAPEYTGDLIRLKSDFENASADYNAAFGLYTQLVSGGNDEESSGGASQDMIDSAKADADAKEEARDEARDAYEDAKYDLRNWLLSELSSAEDNVNYYTDLVNSYESSQTTGFSDLDMLEEDVKTKQRTLDDLITALNKTKASNDNESKISNLDL
ncbi:MAG: RND transporter, partial [Ruminococcus sp.]|nr:RND transporter [Ruminococcus sp.]